MGTQRVQMRGIFVLPWLPSTQNICFLNVHSFVPIARQAGQAVVLGRLSLVRLTAWPTSPHQCKLNTKLKSNFFQLLQLSEKYHVCVIQYTLVQEESIIEKYRLLEHRFCTFIHFCFKGLQIYVGILKVLSNGN
jgi:hypothetical protein